MKKKGVLDRRCSYLKCSKSPEHFIKLKIGDFILTLSFCDAHAKTYIKKYAKHATILE